MTLEKIEEVVGDLPVNDLKDELLFNVKQGLEHILNWMRHIIRSVKANAFEFLQDTSTGFWLSDWAQKVLPVSYRESQREYFGKKRNILTCRRTTDVK